MIVLPTTPKPAMVQPRVLDFGIVQRPQTGAPATYIERGGTRFAADITYPPMDADTARVFVSRLLRGKAQGIRLGFPLSGVSQGTPGAPTVNGTGALGTSLPIKGLTPGYQLLEGYWLNVTDSAGTVYLHNVAETTTAAAGGTVTAEVWPPLRGTFINGNVITLDAPVIEGIVPDPPAWPLPAEWLVTLSFTVEEMA